MVNKDGGCLVMLIDKLALGLQYETWLSQDQLVNRNNLSCLDCLEHLLAHVTVFCLPWHLGHGTKEATSASWQHHFCQLLWYLAIFCQLFRLIKWQVTQAEVPLHQLSLIIVC